MITLVLLYGQASFGLIVFQVGSTFGSSPSLVGKVKIGGGFCAIIEGGN